MNIVKLNDEAGPSGTIDLRLDNRIGDLLDEYELAKRVLRDAKRALDNLSEELNGKIGRARIALVDGWIVKRESSKRSEYKVKSAIVTKLIVERKPKLQAERERAARLNTSDDMTR